MKTWSALGETLDVLLHKVPGIGSQSLAQKVATAFQVGAGDPATADTFWLVSQVHPGLKLCAGLAFAEKITATTTYEIREVNPATGGSGDVLGRVTVTAGRARRSVRTRLSVSSDHQCPQRSSPHSSAMGNARCDCGDFPCCNTVSTSGASRPLPPLPPATISRHPRPSS